MIKTSILIFSILFSSLVNAKEVHKKNKKKNSIKFFSIQAKKVENNYQYNRYENIVSGVSAFVIGNVGYLLTDSSVLKLTYSGIQTIGIINIGRGIYKSNSPSIEKSFNEILSSKNKKDISKYQLSNELVRIFAEEERAKRLSLFYSSSFLAIQYALNIAIYDSPERIKNIYIFLGSVNAIVAAYSAFSKGEYEKFYFGKKIDLNPFAFKANDQNLYGMSLTYRF